MFFFWWDGGRFCLGLSLGSWCFVFFSWGGNLLTHKPFLGGGMGEGLEMSLVIVIR